MSPDPRTPDHLLPVVDELARFDPLFAYANGGAGRDRIDALLVKDFWEVGASGQRYSREFVLDVLERRQQQPDDEVWEARDRHVRELAPDLYLFTYTLVQAARVTQRASVWRRTAGGWKMVYHQGTVCSLPGNRHPRGGGEPELPT